MKIVIFAAHPDDAEVCVGGSICRYVAAGHSVHVVNMTNNHTVRVASAARAAALLGFTYEFLDFPDMGVSPEAEGMSALGVRFDPPHLQVVTDTLREHRPDLVWAHWPVDTQPDHIAAGSLVLRACDNLRIEGEMTPALWFFLPAFGYQSLCAVPNHFEDVSAYMDRKRQAVAEYECINIFEYYPIEETAMKFYGYQNGCLYAEAFVKCHFRIGGPRYKVIGEGRN